MRAKTYVWPFTSSLDERAIDPVDVRAQYGLPEKFLFAPNQFWKHEDHATLFRALTVARGGGYDYTVVCTGAASDYRHPGHYEALRGYVADAGLSGNVRFLGHVPHGTLGQLSASCEA